MIDHRRWLIATCGAFVVFTAPAHASTPDPTVGLRVAAEVSGGFRESSFPSRIPAGRSPFIVPPREAWESGAHGWSAARRREFANDPKLRATALGVTLATNVQRADRDPSRWLPAPTFRCAYVAKWVEVKVTWGLAADPAESARLARILTACRKSTTTQPAPPQSSSPQIVPAQPTSVPQTSPSTTRVASPATTTPLPAVTTTTIAVALTPTTARSGSTVLDQLGAIRIVPEYTAGYNRDLFPHWKDLDRNGCDARQDVLIRDSRTPAVVGSSCRVTSGTWYSPYDGATWTNPSDVDIDHVVALNEAWQSGAYAWTETQRTNYANDLSDRRTLLAVTDSVNQSKSDRDPAEWLPPLVTYRCTYLADWVSVKARWSLAMDESEYAAVRIGLAGCP